MHQTFYIDIDEEITSIVDRLRKAKSKEVVIVVPKRAVLIQSIVNLKLLKKEADSLKKELIIVTQDKFGKMLIEKAGIAVEQKLDDIEGDEVIEPEKENGDDSIKITLGSGIDDPREAEAKNRLERIGSDGYYQSENLDFALGRESFIENKEIEEKEGAEKIINKELVIDVGDDLRKQRSSFGKNIAKRGPFAPMDMIRNVEMGEDDVYDDDIVVEKKLPQRKSREGFRKEIVDGNEAGLDRIDHVQVEDFFEHKKNQDKHKDINVGSGAKKFFFAFSLVAAIAILGAVSYLFLPKAEITIFAKQKVQSADSQVEGSVNVSVVDMEKEIIPAKVISVSDEFSRKHETTGEKNSSNQKAKGVITIYNEFSTSPQPLVATTRFESADKKIFRLVSGVTVPGMENDSGQIKPGAIEAEVIADEAGGEYNIEPTKFTIPGFQSSGSEKYSKIYAKSFKSMAGGGEGSEKVRVVTDADIVSAKAKIIQDIRPALVQKLKDSAGSEYILLDDAVNIDESIYTLSSAVGDIADNFNITVKSKASAIIFKKDDIGKILMGIITKQGNGTGAISEDSLIMEFGKSDTNFRDGSIIIRVHGTGNILPKIDLDNLKVGMLGKDEEELKPYLSAYPDIDRVEVNYWPSFLIGRIPDYASRVELTLDKN